MLQFNANNKERAVRRLFAAGVTFEAPDAHWEVRQHGVELGGFVCSDNGSPDLVSVGRLAVRRAPVLVSLNPAIGRILGYQPGHASLLTVGFDGAVELTLRDFEDREILERAGLPWLVQLSVLPWYQDQA